MNRAGVGFGEVGGAVHGAAVVDAVGEAEEVTGLVGEELFETERNRL